MYSYDTLNAVSLISTLPYRPGASVTIRHGDVTFNVIYQVCDERGNHFDVIWHDDNIARVQRSRRWNPSRIAPDIQDVFPNGFTSVTIGQEV